MKESNYLSSIVGFILIILFLFIIYKAKTLRNETEKIRQVGLHNLWVGPDSNYYNICID